MRRLSRWALGSAGLALLCGAFGVGLTSALAAPERQAPKTAKPKARPSRADLLSNLDPLARSRAGSELVSALDDGHRAVLTLDPDLDAYLSELFDDFEVPFGSVVALEPSSGRVLAYVSHSSAAPGATDHARDASPPAASVFKLITSSALLEHGVTPETNTCYHGGFSVLLPSELEDNPKLDTACVSFTNALSHSVNPVFGKLALKHLARGELARYAGAFGFGELLPFDVPTRASDFDLPSERVELARAAAGFWHSHMSPLHGALIAATVANGGRMMKPFMVDHVEDASGKTSLRTEPALHRVVLERRTAELIGRMMRATVTHGTARKTFFDGRGNPFLPGVSVAGKTGTLSRERPYRGYTWWVGFAPADAPKIALAALVVNSPKWRIKASYMAREALRYYLLELPRIRAARDTLAKR